jgi:flagellar biosynthesis GTPase FlhF
LFVVVDNDLVSNTAKGMKRIHDHTIHKDANDSFNHDDHDPPASNLVLHHHGGYQHVKDDDDDDDDDENDDVNEHDEDENEEEEDENEEDEKVKVAKVVATTQNITRQLDVQARTLHMQAQFQEEIQQQLYEQALLQRQLQVHSPPHIFIYIIYI